MELVPLWLPGGKVMGREYKCASVAGGNGDSCLINLSTGKWSDFAADDRGLDLVSLYAKIKGLKQGEAAKELANQIGYNLQPANISPPKERKDLVLTPPPAGTPQPEMVHSIHGHTSAWWKYTDSQGQPLFYVARYDTKEGKQIVPWSWSAEGKWVSKAWPVPRPLYNLFGLAQRPGIPALVVEGEKAASAANKLLGKSYAVTAWPNGSKAYGKADFSPLYGRKVLLWPDADKPGLDAMQAVAGLLAKHCQEIKILDP